MASSSFIIVLMLALVAGSALAQPPIAAPTVSPTATPTATPIPAVTPPIVAPTTSPPASSPSEGPAAASPPAPPMAPASGPGSSVAMPPGGVAAPPSDSPNAASLNRVTVAGSAALLFVAGALML